MNPPIGLPVAIDKHFSAGWYAELLGVSTDTIVRWFADAPGVVKLGEKAGSRKRRRCELRIPYSVFMRVYEERTR